MVTLAVAVAIFGALALVGAAGQPCGADGSCDTSSGDEMGLLQTLRAGVHANGTATQPCRGTPVVEGAQTKSLINKYLGGKERFGWWSLKPQPRLEELKAKVTAERTDWDLRRAGTFGSASASDMPKLMHDATWVKGVSDKIPKKLQGVFWMKGNAIQEELWVPNFSRWFPDEKILVAPLSPYGWAWPLGKPRNAPFRGLQYEAGPSKAKGNAASMVVPNTVVSLKCSACPASAKYCDQGSSDDLSYCYMQMHTFGNMADITNLGNAVASIFPFVPDNTMVGAFTIQDMSKDGTHWKRTCEWGFNGCAFIDFGSYDLLKIIDGGGKVVEPYYSEFVEYMGGVPALTWTGFTSERQRDSFRRFAEDMVI